jgi:hypothetical protein
MHSLPQLLENNRKWAAARIVRDPDFFTRLASQQAPAFLLDLRARRWPDRRSRRVSDPRRDVS